jgi:hypothetical protein
MAAGDLASDGARAGKSLRWSDLSRQGLRATPLDGAVTVGKLLALESLVAGIIARMPDGDDIVERSLSVGDGIEAGPYSDMQAVRMIGSQARHAMERISGMVTVIRNRLSP